MGYVKNRIFIRHCEINYIKFLTILVKRIKLSEVWNKTDLKMLMVNNFLIKTKLNEKERKIWQLAIGQIFYQKNSLLYQHKCILSLWYLNNSTQWEKNFCPKFTTRLSIKCNKMFVLLQLSTKLLLSNNIKRFIIICWMFWIFSN